MTRDELINDVKEAIEKHIPQNTEIDGDDIDSIGPIVEKVLDDACEAMDSAEDEDDEAAEGTEQKG